MPTIQTHETPQELPPHLVHGVVPEELSESDSRAEEAYRLAVVLRRPYEDAMRLVDFVEAHSHDKTPS